MSERFIATLESMSGRSFGDLQSTPIDEVRRQTEERKGPMKILGEGIMTREQIEEMLDEALKPIE